MKKPLLSACLASMMFSACSEGVSTSPVAGRAAPPLAVPTRVKAPVVRVEAAASLTPRQPVDAGKLAAPPGAMDALALSHEHHEREDHVARARAFSEEGDLRAALAEVRRGLADLPEDEELLEQIASLGKRLKQRELSAEAFGRLARLRAEDPVPLIQQARQLLALGRHEEAMVAASDAAKRDGAHPEAFQALGRAQLATGALAGAMSSFERVLALAPDHGYALNNLGFAALRANENARALEALTRAAALLPHVAYVHNNLGLALQRAGDAEQARLAFARATSLSPKYVKARVNLERVALAVMEDPELTEELNGEPASEAVTEGFSPDAADTARGE